MQPSTQGTITKIIISVLKQLYDGETITVSPENQETIVLQKVATINSINVYEPSQQFVNNGYIYWGTDLILWETDLILDYGYNAFIGLNPDDHDYNHVNDMIPDYCIAAPGELTFSVYIFARKAAVTIFVAN